MVTQNYSDAIKWFKKAAEQGDPYAINALRKREDKVRLFFGDKVNDKD